MYYPPHHNIDVYDAIDDGGILTEIRLVPIYIYPA